MRNLPAMIETLRLILRRPCIGDYPAFCAIFSDPEAVAYMGGIPLTAEESWTRFLRDVGHWSVKQHGLFSIIEKEKGACIGKTGYACYERDVGTSAQTGIEASWIIHPRYHRKGYATEAALAAQKWFDNRHGHNRTACIINPDNKSSLRIALKLGFSPIGQLRRPEGIVDLFIRDTRLVVRQEVE